MTGPVSHPRHYIMLPFEVIEIVGFMAFPEGCVLKYLMRAPFKGHEKEDLLKAKWYIVWLQRHTGRSVLIYGKQLRKTQENADALEAKHPDIAAAIRYFVAGRTHWNAAIESITAAVVKAGEGESGTEA